MNNNKDVIIIGGAGPLAGSYAFNNLIEIFQKRFGFQRDYQFPYVALLSFPFPEMLHKTNFDELKVVLHNLIERECHYTQQWMIACNTLHLYLSNYTLPPGFVNLLQMPVPYIKQKPLVLCTSTAKNAEIHKQYYDCDYLTTDQNEIDEIIDLVLAGQCQIKCRERLVRLLNKYKHRQIILGCSELSLISNGLELRFALIDPLFLAVGQIARNYTLNTYHKNVGDAKCQSLT